MRLAERACHGESMLCRAGGMLSTAARTGCHRPTRCRAGCALRAVSFAGLLKALPLSCPLPATQRQPTAKLMLQRTPGCSPDLDAEGLLHEHASSHQQPLAAQIRIAERCVIARGGPQAPAPLSDARIKCIVRRRAHRRNLMRSTAEGLGRAAAHLAMCRSILLKGSPDGLQQLSDGWSDLNCTLAGRPIHGQ